MTSRKSALFVVVFLAASAARAVLVYADDGADQSRELGTRSPSAIGVKYLAQCRAAGVRCTVTYDEGVQNTTVSAAKKPVSPDNSFTVAPEPLLSGPLSAVLVIALLFAAIGLWMRFGSGGVLLSPTPSNTVPRRGEAPKSWENGGVGTEEVVGDFLQRIASMVDRRQALVLLLRHCLLHAADVTNTRLFRSDTERAVFARLPDTMPDLDHLESLLKEVELVHYGGRTVAENHFGMLLGLARELLSVGRLSHA